MNWTNFADYNSAEVIAQYITDIDPPIKDIYDMLSNVTVEKRQEILEDSNMLIDKVRASAYYLGYIGKPNNMPLLEAYGIELLPEEKARKIRPKSYHDAIACYKRGFIDSIKTMTLDNIIVYGVEQDVDRYILELLSLRPDWLEEVHVVGGHVREILLLYPSLLQFWLVLAPILTGSEIIDVVNRSGLIDEPWIPDILDQYSDTSVLRYALEHNIPLNITGILHNISDTKVLEYIALDDELEYMTNSNAVGLYIRTGRSIFLKFKNKNMDELKVKYSRDLLDRLLSVTLSTKIILVMDKALGNLDITDSNIRTIYNKGYTIEVTTGLELDILVRLLDYIPIDRFLEKDKIYTLPTKDIVQLYKSYPLGVKRLWELYSEYYPVSLDIMAYHLPISVTEKFRPSVTQLTIYNYLKKDKPVHPYLKHGGDMTIKQLPMYR